MRTSTLLCSLMAAAMTMLIRTCTMRGRREALRPAEGRIKTLFWPKIDYDADVDNLTNQGSGFVSSSPHSRWQSASRAETTRRYHRGGNGRSAALERARDLDGIEVAKARRRRRTGGCPERDFRRQAFRRVAPGGVGAASHCFFPAGGSRDAGRVEADLAIGRRFPTCLTV
jgi:hypothetical protein